MDGQTLDDGWIVARTKPRQEDYAQENVTRQGYHSYLPKCIDARTSRVSVLFPGYLFVQTCREKWTWLRSTYGVLDLVFGSEGAPAALSETIVKQLKERESDDGLVHLPYERFRIGQCVRIGGGLFYGSTGLYQGVSGNARVRVLLQFLGAYTPVDVEEGLVEEAA